MRVKFLDLNADSSFQRFAGTPVVENLPMAMSLRPNGLREEILAHPQSGNAECFSNLEQRSVKVPEICVDQNRRLADGGLENHVETCSVCANRLDLQMDFMECLESAIYLRLNEPHAAKIHGALLVSAPKMKFAICGELELRS